MANPRTTLQMDLICDRWNVFRTTLGVSFCFSASYGIARLPAAACQTPAQPQAPRAENRRCDIENAQTGAIAWPRALKCSSYGRNCRVLLCAVNAPSTLTCEWDTSESSASPRASLLVPDSARGTCSRPPTRGRCCPGRLLVAYRSHRSEYLFFASPQPRDCPPTVLPERVTIG